MLKIGDFVGHIEPPRAEVRIPKVWYILRIHPNLEKPVRDRLTARGFCCYLPVEHRTRRTVWHRRVPVELPIFPGTMFIPDFEADIRKLRDHADGILGYVRYGDTVAYANAKTMASVRSFEAYCNTPMGQRPRYKPGEVVRVVDGPLSYYVGRFQNLDDKGRLKVLVEVLGRQVSVEVDEDQIEPV